MIARRTYSALKIKSR